MELGAKSPALLEPGVKPVGRVPGEPTLLRYHILGKGKRLPFSTAAGLFGQTIHFLDAWDHLLYTSRQRKIRPNTAPASSDLNNRWAEGLVP
jgi:hypothetical protein